MDDSGGPRTCPDWDLQLKEISSDIIQKGYEKLSARSLQILSSGKANPWWRKGERQISKKTCTFSYNGAMT
jgi:hypothetical protein